MTIDTKIDTKTNPRLPAELVASTLFLLKRLGFTAKQRSLEEYEQAGLGPYHHAILVLLDEGVPETQAAIADSLGYDRGTLVGLRGAGARRAEARSRRPAAPRRPDHSRRRAHAHQAACPGQARGG
jgi:hypothetical protein